MARPSERRELERAGGEPWRGGGGWAPLGGRPERYTWSLWYGAPLPYPGMRAGRERRGPLAWVGDRIASAADRLSARLRGGGERMGEALREGGETLAHVVRERGEQVGEQLRSRARGPRGYRRSDDRVLEEVCERIAASPIDASDVEIQVNNGAVTVTGRVASKNERRLIEDIADAVFGVTEVRNALRVAKTPEEMAVLRGGFLRCEDLMKRDPVCSHESDSIQTVASRMRTANVGFVPICAPDGRPVGTITDRDLAVRALAEGKSPQTPVSEVMSREVIACAPNDDLREAEQKMRDHRKSRIMVCDASGKLVGIISLSDILEHEESGAAAETARGIAQREAQS